MTPSGTSLGLSQMTLPMFATIAWELDQCFRSCLRCLLQPGYVEFAFQEGKFRNGSTERSFRVKNLTKYSIRGHPYRQQEQLVCEKWLGRNALEARR